MQGLLNWILRPQRCEEWQLKTPIKGRRLGDGEWHNLGLCRQHQQPPAGKLCFLEKGYEGEETPASTALKYLDLVLRFTAVGPWEVLQPSLFYRGGHNGPTDVTPKPGSPQGMTSEIEGLKNHKSPWCLKLINISFSHEMPFHFYLPGLLWKSQARGRKSEIFHKVPKMTLFWSIAKHMTSRPAQPPHWQTGLESRSCACAGFCTRRSCVEVSKSVTESSRSCFSTREVM